MAAGSGRRKIVHAGVRTVLRPAAYGDKAAAELIDIVLDRPMTARFPHQVGPDFRDDHRIRSFGVP